MSYRSLNTPSKRDVLGTSLSGVLAGHKRYAHITRLRGAAVGLQIFGNEQKSINQDALRRALARLKRRGELREKYFQNRTFACMDEFEEQLVKGLHHLE